jgi:hypothetical protein
MYHCLRWLMSHLVTIKLCHCTTWRWLTWGPWSSNDHTWRVARINHSYLYTEKERRNQVFFRATLTFLDARNLDLDWHVDCGTAMTAYGSLDTRNLDFDWHEKLLCTLRANNSYTAHSFPLGNGRYRAYILHTPRSCSPCVPGEMSVAQRSARERTSFHSLVMLWHNSALLAWFQNAWFVVVPLAVLRPQN